MKHIDSDEILRNRTFNEELEDALDVAQSNFEGAGLDDDRVRLEAQIVIRTLRSFRERFEHHVRTVQ